MRSRYTAHALGEVDYILNSWAPEQRQQLSRQEIADWVEQHDWLGLQVIQSRQGQAHQQQGSVEFIAYYRPKGDNSQRLSLHELSNFHKHGERWFYVDGHQPKGIPRAPGRNDPCPCGSGKKFKKCCL